MSVNNVTGVSTSRASNLPNRNSQRSTLLKVVILGDGGVGKSCLMNRFVSNHFDEHSFHTIGVEFLNKDIEINGEAYTLQIWDTAGQERFKTLRTPFYRGSDICLLTYAVDDRISFKNLALWRSEFLYYADVREGSSFPFIIVGNKVDVLESERQVSTEEARAWCAENGNPPLVETSAKDATNVEAAFGAAVATWVRLEARLERPLIEDTVDLSKQQSPHRSSCCMPVSSTETKLRDGMSFMPLWPNLQPKATDPLWFNADKPCDDESEVLALEMEHQAWREHMRAEGYDHIPIGKSASDFRGSEEEEEEEEEEEGEGEEEEESDTHEEEEEELDEIDMEVSYSQQQQQQQ